MHPAKIDIQLATSGQALIIRMKGRLDTIMTPLVEHQVYDLIDKGSHKIIFDLQGVDYLSSAGLRMLLSTAKKLKSANGKLVVCNISDKVMQVLKMSGFDRLLECTSTESEALGTMQL